MNRITTEDQITAERVFRGMTPEDQAIIGAGLARPNYVFDSVVEAIDQARVARDLGIPRAYSWRCSVRFDIYEQLRFDAEDAARDAELALLDEDDDYGAAPNCPQCGRDETGVSLGALGNHVYWRCRCCGWVFD